MSKAKKVTEYLNWDEETSIYFQVAANLHDIGKLRTPRAILEKNGSLTKEEYKEIQEHAYLTYTILGSIDGFEQIHRWASAHHERNDGSGYPFGLKGDELSHEAKILSCLDMYQALVETRPYREAMSHTKAVEILYEQVPKKFFEKNIVDLVANIFASEELICQSS